MTDGQNYPDVATQKRFWQNDTQNGPTLLYLSHALFDHPGCYGSLSLPQGEGIEPLGHPTGLRQLDQGTCRVLYKYKEITRLLSIELLIL